MQGIDNSEYDEVLIQGSKIPSVTLKNRQALLKPSSIVSPATVAVDTSSNSWVSWISYQNLLIYSIVISVLFIVFVLICVVLMARRPSNYKPAHLQIADTSNKS
jgi:hypothetical protein